MRKSNIELARERRAAEEAKKIRVDIRGLVKLMLGDDPNPTQWAFIQDQSFHKAYMGPAGCAKTTTGCAAGLLMALFRPGSKGLVARHDYNDLKDTTAQTMERMLNRLPKGTLVDRDKSAPMKWWIAPAIPGVESQITFMGLKESPGSYEYDWIFIDEADEVERLRVDELDGRLRASGKGGFYTMMMAFNPPAKSHWLYEACTGRNALEQSVAESTWKLFLPEPRENQSHLPDDYYDKLAKGKPEEVIQRLVRGEWGSTFPGQPVYREFRQSVHVRRKLDYETTSPLLRFWDFGYNRPACVWAQLDFEGRLLVFDELIGDQEEAIQFVRRVKSLTAVRFCGCSHILDFGDPAARQQKDTGSTASQLAREGITLRYVISSIDEGLQLVRQRLGMLISGEPAIQIDERCIVLVDALKGGYRMDRLGAKPMKDGFYEHIADAFRYGVLNVLGGMGARQKELPLTLAYESAHDAGMQRSIPTPKGFFARPGTAPFTELPKNLTGRED